MSSGGAAPWFETALSVLAVWRLAHLLARERGPFDLVSRLHAWLAGRPGASLLGCPYCLSLWLAAIPAGWLAHDVVGFVLLWLGISGGACVIERLLPPDID